MRTPRTELVGARLGPAERAALVALAEREHLNLSEALRTSIREACRQRGLWPPDEAGEGVTT